MSQTVAAGLLAAGILSGCGNSGAPAPRPAPTGHQPPEIGVTKVLKCWNYCGKARIAIYIKARRIFEGSTSLNLSGSLSPTEVTDVDVSAAGRDVAYADLHGMTHLVDVGSLRDRRLGKGPFGFSPEGRYLAFLRQKGSTFSGQPTGNLIVYDLHTGQSAVMGKHGYVASNFSWSHARDRLVWTTWRSRRAVNHGTLPGLMQVARASAPTKSRILSFRREADWSRSLGDPAFSWDGRSVLYWRAVASDTFDLMSRRIRRGRHAVRLARTLYNQDVSYLAPPPSAMKGGIVCDICDESPNEVAFFILGRSTPARKVWLPHKGPSPQEISLDVSPDGHRVLVGWVDCQNCTQHLNFYYGIWQPGMKKVHLLGKGLYPTWITKPATVRQPS